MTALRAGRQWFDSRHPDRLWVTPILLSYG